MQISERQKEILDLMADPQITELLIGGSAGCASVYGQEVKTPFGFKKIEDVKVGDQISNVNGGVSRVVDIPYDGYIECYGVTFSDGAYTEVSKNHLWKYKVAGNKRNGHEGRRHLTEYVIGTTEQLRDKIDKEHILIPLTKPVVFTRSFPHTDKMAPYLLGVLLGDGGFSQPQGSVLITNPDKEIIEKCRQEISGEIIHVRDELTWRLANCDIEKRRLEKFGLMGKHSWEKFIPECYKLGSIEERLEILRGLIDTDGYVDKGGRLYFTSSSQRLAEDVQFIARSLGANATLTVGPAGYKKEGEYIKCRDAYTVYIQHEHKEWFVTLPRKRDRIKPYNGGYAPCKRIIKIESIGVKHARCLTTSETDGLYLTNDFIVTHNSKSFSIGLMIALWAKQYPGVRFFVGRKTLKSLKQSTLNTLLNKVFPALGIGYDEYRMQFQEMVLTFVNGSTIIFGELDYLPSDPDYARLGSLEIDVAVVDEAGEITRQAKNALKSRTGRGVLAQEYDIPGKLLLSCNPQQGWLKTEFYDVFEKNGGGFFQKWPFGEVEVKGEKKTAYRAFLRMWAYDNPFLPKSYIDNLKALPDRERKRLLEGNWNYADDDNMLFKSGLLDRATTYDLPEKTDKFDKVIGCFDETTEILTDSGFKKFRDLKGNERVLARKSDGVSEYIPYDNYIEYNYAGEMYEVERQGASVFVTPNHKMLYAPAKGETELREIQAITDKEWRIIRQHEFRQGLFQDEFPFELGYNKKDFFAFLGWFISEGCVYGLRDINITQRDERKKDIIRALLVKMGIRFSESKQNFKISDRKLASWLLGNTKKYAHDKEIPRLVTYCSNWDYIEAFLDAYCDGDGMRRKGQRLCYVSSSKKIIDSLQIILSHFNRQGRVSLKEKAGSETVIEGRKVIRLHDVYILYERWRDSDVWVKNYTAEKKDFKGKVYCISNRYHTIFVRRNGACYWIGNCDVAASGGDRTVYTLIENGVVTTQKVSNVATNWDKRDERPLFRLMADELIEFAQRNGFTSKQARNIAIEGNGIGQALMTCIKERGWYATEYTATHKSRSENYYQLMLDFDAGTLKLYHELTGLDELRKELAGHTYELQNQTPSVCKKNEIKLKIGRSPDLADSLQIACFSWHNMNDKSDDRHNQNRILF